MALSAEEKARWSEIDSIIAEHKHELKAAETHEELKNFAEEQGFMNQSDFGKFKFSLRKIAVNYDELRTATFAQRDKERAEELSDLDDDAPLIQLWVGAVEGDDDSAAFAICNDDDDAIWYGQFFDDDRIRQVGDLVSAEQSVADKAVWLASKAREAADVTAARLYLYTTCPQLDEAALAATGARFGIAVEVIVDEDERAIQMAEAPGYKRWQDNDLAELVSVDG